MPKVTRGVGEQRALLVEVGEGGLLERIHLFGHHQLALLEHQHRVAVRRQHGRRHAAARARADDDRINLELGVLGVGVGVGVGLGV